MRIPFQMNCMNFSFMLPVLPFGGSGLQTKLLADMRKTLSAIKYALAGLRYAFRFERNYRIEVLCAAGACAAAYLLHITPMEWCIIFINIGAVLSAELFNTAIEKMCNKFSTEIRPAIKMIKDVSAAAVLILSIISLLCGLIIFLPYLIRLL